MPVKIHSTSRWAHFNVKLHFFSMGVPDVGHQAFSELAVWSQKIQSGLKPFLVVISNMYKESIIFLYNTMSVDGK